MFKMFFLAPDHRWCPVAGGSIKEEEEEDICVYFSIYLCMLYAPIFLAQMFLKPRFKIDAVIMIICSIVIIINSVLTLQVSTAKPMIVDLAK